MDFLITLMAYISTFGVKVMFSLDGVDALGINVVIGNHAVQLYCMVPSREYPGMWSLALSLGKFGRYPVWEFDPVGSLGDVNGISMVPRWRTHQGISLDSECGLSLSNDYLEG